MLVSRRGGHDEQWCRWLETKESCGTLIGWATLDDPSSSCGNDAMVVFEHFEHRR